MTSNKINTFAAIVYWGMQGTFIGLKLFGQIDWSWWWVMFPLLLDLGAYTFKTLVKDAVKEALKE